MPSAPEFPLISHPTDAFLADLVRASVEGVCVTTADLSRTIFANPAFLQLFGLTAAQLGNHPRAWLEAIAPLEGRGLETRLRQLPPGGSCLLTHRVTAHAGAEILLETRFRLAPATGWLELVARDVTQLHQSQQRDAVIAGAIERSIDGFAITDAQGRYTFMNDAHAAIFGYASGAEFIGREWTALYRAEEVRFIHENVFPTLLRTGQWQGEVPGQHKDGSVFPQTLSLTLLPDGGILCSCRDDSDRQRAQALAQQSDALSRALLEEAPMPVVLRNQFGNIVLTNSAGRSLIERAGGTKLAIGTTPLPEALRAPGEQLPLGGAPRTHDARVITAAGEEYYSCFQFLLPADSHGRRFMCMIAVDLTQDRRSAEEAQRTLERQQAYLTLQRQLVASVSHEFRTPLAAIQNATFLLANYGQGTGADKRAKWLKILHDSTENLRILVEEVLELNQLELAVRELRTTPLCAGEWIETLAERFNTASGKPRVFVTRPVGPPRARLIDKALFSRAIENLVSNALKFSPMGAPVEVVLTETGDRLTVRVHDHGRGIPAEEIARLREPFYRASNAEGVPGSGLGLTITHRAVELHGGRLHCESRLGGGTTFTFSIDAPLAPYRP